MSQESKNLKIAVYNFSFAMDNFNFVKDNEMILCSNLLQRVKDQLHETHRDYLFAIEEFKKSTNS